MDRAYDDIPRQGKHQGPALDEEPTTSVRAQEAVKPTAQDETAFGVTVFAYNEEAGRYQVRRWKSESEVDLPEDYSEIRRVRESEPATEMLDAIPGDGQFVVLENAESGDVYFDREFELTDNWSDEGRFNQFTVFEDEEAAAEYANSRQSSS